MTETRDEVVESVTIALSDALEARHQSWQAVLEIWRDLRDAGATADEASGIMTAIWRSQSGPPDG